MVIASCALFSLTVYGVVIVPMLPLVEHNLRWQDHRRYATHRHNYGHSDEKLELKEETLEPLLSGCSERG